MCLTSILVGVLIGMSLYTFLPEMDALKKQWYSKTLAPIIEELLKFSPIIVGFHPVFVAIGFGLFEVFVRRREKPIVLLLVLLFHTASTGIAYYYQPLGIFVAILSHYYLNRRTKVMDSIYLTAILLLLFINKLL